MDMRNRSIHDLESSIAAALNVDRVIIEAVEFAPETALTALSPRLRTTVRACLRVTLDANLPDGENRLFGGRESADDTASR